MKQRLLSVLMICFLGVSSQAFSVEEFGFFATIIEKDDANYARYYERFVSDTHELVLTPNTVSPTSMKFYDVIDDGRDYYFVELLDPYDPALMGMTILGFDRVRLVYLTKDEIAQVHEEFPFYFISKVPFNTLYTRTYSKPLVELGGQKVLEPSYFHGRDEVTEQWLNDKLSELSGAKPVVVGGRTFTITERSTASGRKNARDYLASEYAKLGLEVSEHNYGSGVNFIAEKKSATSPKYVIVSAHYDSMRNAGADDDASGVIGSLAIAKALASADTSFGIRLVAFDQEENGLIGSKAYAGFLDQSGDLDNLIGVVNLEMLGYDADSDGKFHSIHCNENTSKALHDKFMAEVNSRSSLGLEYVSACTNRSDHASFWRYSKPAIVVSQNFFGWPSDSNPCYHRQCDKVDQLNFDYMKRLVDVLIPTVESLVR